MKQLDHHSTFSVSLGGVVNRKDGYTRYVHFLEKTHRFSAGQSHLGHGHYDPENTIPKNLPFIAQLFQDCK